MAEKYFVSAGVILKMFLPTIPKRLKKSEEVCLVSLKESKVNQNTIPFYNAAKPVLLRYYNFDNKIQAYLSLIKNVLNKNKQILIIFPFISEAKKFSQNLSEFENITCLFLNNLSPSHFRKEWLKIKTGQVKIIIGTRSAIFAPFKNLDLIIIDEEDNENHKQEEPNPRYNVKSVAIISRDLLKCKVIFTSLTPSLNSLYQVTQKNWQYFELDKLVGLPMIKIIDRQIENKKGNYSIFSQELTERIEYNLKRAKKVFIFLNRKGLATLIRCQDCGYLASCPTCHLPLTYHANKELICHHCNYKEALFLFCPKCKGPNIKLSGTGTEKVEIELKKIFPQSRILKIDIDSPLLNQNPADFDIIIGTQYAFDLINWQEINLIGVINADTLLYLSDYRGLEKTFNLLVKLSLFLADSKKELIIQTFSPDNYCFSALKNLDYKLFFQKELSERKTLNYPPFCQLIKLIYQSIEFNAGQSEINKVYQDLQLKVKDSEMAIYPPLLAYTQQVRGRWRWQIIIKILKPNLDLKFLNDLSENIIIDSEPENLF
ncbi:MAG: primosomal protein N' [Candidatus Parcubacteria bacterium]|nr:primosomal protein N' [Candidatus Parcubacteria bacterium]